MVCGLHRLKDYGFIIKENNKWKYMNQEISEGQNIAEIIKSYDDIKNENVYLKSKIVELENKIVMLNEIIKSDKKTIQADTRSLTSKEGR